MQNKVAELEKFIKEHDRLFVDSSAFLIDQNNSVALKAFWHNITPLLKQYRKKIIVPLSVVNELVKHANTSSDSNLRHHAKDAVNLVQILHKSQIIDIFGDKNDNTHADNVFDVIFTKFRIYYTMLLITRDYNLARDILALNDKKATFGKKIEVCIISDDGFLLKAKTKQNAPNDSNAQSNGESIHNTTQIHNGTQPNLKPFQIGVMLTQISNEIIKTSLIPKSGDFIFTPSGAKVALLNEIGKGGEGAVYETNTQYIAKIYFANKITKRIAEKIQLMISRKVVFEGICFPVEILLNAHNEFVGYLMPKAKGYQLQKTMFSKPLLQKYFPNFKKRDMIEICITILKKIEFLHSINVILGDINPSNILVVSPKEVYFVDTDSYQIEGFPCPVGTINFTAPEIQGKKYDSFLRSIGNEKFAVATLLFMIMLPGKPPYSQQGGESPAENIKNGKFPYGFKGESNGNAPDGSWKYMWSHLPYTLKESFYYTFIKDGQYNDKNNRINATKWLKIFVDYQNQLHYMMKVDEMSNDIFPSRLRKVKGRKYIECKLCGKDTDEECGQIGGICKDCLFSDTKAEIYKCSCGAPIFYKNYDKYIKRRPKPKMCYDCFKKLKGYR